MISHYENPKEYKALIFDEQKRILLEELRGYSMFSDQIEVFDAKGNLVVFYSEGEGGFVSYKKGLKAFKDKKGNSLFSLEKLSLTIDQKAACQEVCHEEIKNEYVMSYTRPLIHENERVGFIKATVYLQKRIFERFSVPLLLIREGRIISKRENFITYDYFTKAIKMPTPYPSIHLIDHDTYYLVEKQYPYFDAILVAKKEDINRELFIWKLWILLVFTLVSLLTMGIIYLSVNNTVLKPLSAISFGIKELKSGNYRINVAYDKKMKSVILSTLLMR